MENKKILIFARDPGGCNSVSPLYQFLVEKGFEVSIWANDFALGRMRENFHLDPQNLNKKIGNMTAETISQWLAKEKPFTVITGTSFGDYTEQWIWQACLALKIPSMAILDHWINYGVRFRNPSAVSVFPDTIIVADNDARTLAVEEGLPMERIKVWGNPYYDYLINLEKTARIQKIRNLYLENGNGILMSFASEPFSITPKNYGYNESEILKELVESTVETNSQKTPISLVVRPHPKENRENLEAFVKTFKSENTKIFVSNVENPIELIQSSDLILGMISQFLIEGAVMKKPVLSLQMGLSTKDPFILTQKGVVPLIKSRFQLDETLQKFLKGTLMPANFEITSNCMSQIANELERLK
jgi:hypothetical protein